MTLELFGQMDKQPGNIYIGTSNVVIPGNKNTFPPAFQSAGRLHYYSHLFNTVEINSSFYKTPMRSTYEKWVLETAPGFRFSLKLSKEVTHVKELVRDTGCIPKFLSAATGTGHKKGCLLIQFPGKITLNYFTQVERIMRELQQYDAAGDWKKAVEFRSADWYTGETWELLDEYGAAMVLHDKTKSKIAGQRGKANFVYMRLHGPQGDYRDSYTDAFLSSKTPEIREWSAAGKEVYIYFNNTIGNAFENAQTLKRLLQA